VQKNGTAAVILLLRSFSTNSAALRRCGAGVLILPAESEGYQHFEDSVSGFSVVAWQSVCSSEQTGRVNRKLWELSAVMSESNQKKGEYQAESLSTNNRRKNDQ
jgi:hypothetical protein